MLIGQLEKLSGFSRDTIRYYEKIGLIEVPRNARRENNYKDYPHSVLLVLKAIRKYKELGFTLEEIRELLVRQSINVLDIKKLIEVIDLKITGMDMQIEKLHEYKMRLTRERAMLERRNAGKLIDLPEMKRAA